MDNGAIIRAGETCIRPVATHVSVVYVSRPQCQRENGSIDFSIEKRFDVFTISRLAKCRRYRILVHRFVSLFEINSGLQPYIIDDCRFHRANLHLERNRCVWILDSLSVCLSSSGTFVIAVLTEFSFLEFLRWMLQGFYRSIEVFQTSDEKTD